MPTPWRGAGLLALACTLRAASGQDTGGVRGLLGKDANGVWWPVTIVSEHADGTVACVVHDDEGTMWPSVHRGNLMLDDPRPGVQQPPQPESQQIALAPGTKDSVVLAVVASMQKTFNKVCVFCWNFFEGTDDFADGQPPADPVAPRDSKAELCMSNPGCAHLGGEGSLCCPTVEGIDLDCCRGIFEPPPPDQTAQASAADWAPVGLERSDLLGSWYYDSGSFSISSVGGHLHFDTQDPRMPGGRGGGDFFVNRVLGSAALPTAPVQSGNEQRVWVRIWKVEGDQIYAEIKRDGVPDWAQLVAMRAQGAAQVPAPVAEQPAPVAPPAFQLPAQGEQQGWVPVDIDMGAALLGQWGYGAGAFSIVNVQGQLHFQEHDPRLPGGVTSGALSMNSRGGPDDLPTARLTAGDGSQTGAVRLHLHQSPGADDQLGVTLNLPGDSDWRAREIISVRVPP